MRFLLLPEVQPGVAQADVGAVVLRRVFKVFLSLDIIAFCVAEQEGFHQIVQIVGNGRAGNGDILYRPQRIGDLAGIGKGADRRAQIVRQLCEHVRKGNVITFGDILEVDLRKQALQVGHLVCIRFSGQDQRHPAIQGILFICLRLVSANGGIILPERDWINADLIAAAAENGQNILCQHF